MANPLILYDNVYDDGTPTATVTAGGYSVLFIKDWKTYTFWKGDATDPTYITVDCGEGTITTTGANLCTNGADFTGGPPPTGWTATDCTLTAVAGGEAGNCLELTSTGGNVQYASYNVTLTKGKAYRFTAYVKSGTSGDDDMYLYAYDNDNATWMGQTSDTSSGAWVQKTLDFTATGVSCSISVYKNTTHAASPGTMLFDTIVLKELTNVPIANTLGIHTHNLYTVGATISVEISSDNNTWHEIYAGFAPTDNLNILKSFSTDYYARYWRLKITGHTAAPEIAILCIGEALDFPTPPRIPVDIYEIEMSGDGKLSKTGQLLGAVIRNKPVRMEYSFAGSEYTYTWVGTTYKAFWTNHASELKPFFFGLDLANYTDLHWLCRIPTDSSFSIPFIMKSVVGEMTFEYEALWGV